MSKEEQYREALKHIAYLRPAGDVERCVGAKKLVAQIERIAINALNSSTSSDKKDPA